MAGSHHSVWAVRFGQLSVHHFLAIGVVGAATGRAQGRRVVEALESSGFSRIFSQSKFPLSSKKVTGSIPAPVRG